MCDALAIGIVSGVGSAVAGIGKANAEYQAQRAAARRQNQINNLNYQNQLNIAARKDKIKGMEYTRNLEAHAAAVTALENQKALNQQEKNRASVAAQQELEEKITEMAFEEQANLAKAIQAQGTILAGEQQAGQSLLLSLMETDRQLGFESAQANASMRDANKAYRIQEYGFDLDQYSADSAAMNRLPGAPQTPWASMGPVKLPDVPMPSKAGRNAAIFGSLVGGIGTGLGAASSYRTASKGNWGRD